MKIKCMVVDDEPLAQRVLEKYINSLDSLELVKKCGNGLEALSYLHKDSVDIIFLDIKMPELSGLEFLKTLDNPPQIIITTAYSEYALEGYEYSVVDYLMKPIPFERFLKAVNKVIDKRDTIYNRPSLSTSENTKNFVFLKSDKVNHKVFFSEIQYIEGCGNFIKVYTDDKMLIVSERMTNIENILPGKLFLRIHKSYIVSIKKINQVVENKVKTGDKMLPIGNFYKRRVKDLIKHLGISTNNR
jgi:DNA-binding LytR/AlgR family response regulator